jgi:hypothetical protein
MDKAVNPFLKHEAIVSTTVSRKTSHCAAYCSLAAYQSQFIKVGIELPEANQMLSKKSVNSVNDFFKTLTDSFSCRHFTSKVQFIIDIYSLLPKIFMSVFFVFLYI